MNESRSLPLTPVVVECEEIFAEWSDTDREEWIAAHEPK